MSFFYVHVTRKSCQNAMFVQKICTFNVDEIDYRLATSTSYSTMPGSFTADHSFITLEIKCKESFRSISSVFYLIACRLISDGVIKARKCDQTKIYMQQFNRYLLLLQLNSDWNFCLLCLLLNIGSYATSLNFKSLVIDINVANWLAKNEVVIIQNYANTFVQVTFTRYARFCLRCWR
jgi:hypothetical protein